MKYSVNALLLLAMVFLFASCAKKLLVTNGASSNSPLLFSGEYKTENLKPIEVEGHAFWGIPSFKKNNRNNHKSGFLFYFNGVEVGRLPRIVPILTMLGYAYGSQQLIQTIGGRNNDGFGEYRLKFVPSLLLGLPLAGTLNNLMWNNAALSGASASMRYKLIEENPNVDVFFYPKYDLEKKNIFSDGKVNLRYLWFQDANLKARVSGATLIHKK